MHSSGESLDELVLEAHAGSGAAYTAIWELLSPVVAGYLRAVGVGDVARVTSDVFLASFTDESWVAGTGGDFRCHLFAVASRHAGEEIRRDAGRAWSGSEHMDQLPADQRDVLLLRVVAELSVEQVAAVIGRPPEAVRQLQHRGLARLRRRLAAAAGERRASDGRSPLVIKAASW